MRRNVCVQLRTLASPNNRFEDSWYTIIIFSFVRESPINMAHYYREIIHSSFSFLRILFFSFCSSLLKTLRIFICFSRLQVFVITFCHIYVLTSVGQLSKSTHIPIVRVRQLNINSNAYQISKNSIFCYCYFSERLSSQIFINFYIFFTACCQNRIFFLEKRDKFAAAKVITLEEQNKKLSLVKKSRNRKTFNFCFHLAVKRI